MKQIKTIHLIGLGAVGATYASIIYNYNKSSIKVILDEERLARYQNGTLINGVNYNFDLVVPKVGDEKAELILVVVKGHQLEKAIETISPLVGENTIILSILNGITSEEELSLAFGKDRILHGFCVATDAVRENNEIIYTKTGRIVFGEHYKDATGKAALVSEFFSSADVPHTLSEDILKEMWWKFMMNVGVNQTSAILGATYGVYNDVPEARELMTSACREVLELSVKEGIPLSEDDITEYFKIMSTLSPKSKTSMLQDIEANRKTEVESFALTVINLGKKHGIPTPVNEILYQMIRVLESKSSINLVALL